MAGRRRPRRLEAPPIAYVFWHTPRPSASRRRYEAALRRFVGSLDAHPPSGLQRASTARLPHPPWNLAAGPIYEDWYVLDDFASLGAIRAVAYERPWKAFHRAVARGAATATSSVYQLLAGDPSSPSGGGSAWFSLPAPARYSTIRRPLIQLVEGAGVGLWRRQLALGPAPEFCVRGDLPRRALESLGIRRVTYIDGVPIANGPDRVSRSAR